MYKKTPFSLIVLLLLSLTGLHAQSDKLSGLLGSLRARHIGPAVMSGRISSLDVVNAKPEIIYIGAAGGGVWKSISGSADFRPVFDDYTQSIGKIAIDQNNPETVWVGTGEPWVRNSVSVGTGIYKTTDGGSNWKHMGLKDSERISDIVIHPKDPNTVYVAALGHLWNANEERGIFKTTDGGATWKKILYLDEHTGGSDLEIDPENPDIVYAAMWSFRRLPWTFDSGFNGKSGLYKSTDGGATWNLAHNGLPQETLGRLAVAVAPSKSNVVYLTVECKSKDKKGLYLSEDKGGSWKKISNDFNTTVRPFYFSRMVVDPKNDSIVMKCGLNMIITEDRGDRFRAIDGTVHSDIHDVWIDPNNTKHLIIGTDGGAYESFDRGSSFKMWMNLPLSQFYHVSVDDEKPFNVYGGLQDNGSWYGPSRKAGGITNSDWKNSFGGDGFYSFRHPTKKEFIFSEYQGGNFVRYNSKTGVAKEIKPYPAVGEAEFRFNWNTPIHLSPTNTDRMYFASQYLFMSNDLGDTWKRISPDLTTNNPEKQKQKQSGGLTIDNSTAENHCTIYAIAESYKDGNIVWAGTDDGNLQVTANAGGSWSNVTGNLGGLPANTWVSYIEPGRFDKNTAFATFDGHRTGDMKTYVYKTTDLGKTWKSLATPQIEGYAYCIRQDLVNPELLFLGTEFGLYISVDGGANWARFENNLPKVAIHDMVIHPRDPSLVLATHGRGVILLDDITPLRQLSLEVMKAPLHFFELAPTVLRDPGAGGNWFGGSGNYVAGNPPSSAQIAYYMSKRHTFGKMDIEIWKDGKLLRTIPAGKSAGINVVEMPTSMEKPKAPPTNNRMALFGSLFGPNLEAGKYDVKVIKGKDTYTSTFTLATDPESVYSDAERKLQRETTLGLYNMSEQLAYIYHVFGDVEKKAGALGSTKGKLKKTLDLLIQKAKTGKDTLVALGGDFYVDEDERLGERISDLYRQVSSYPGQPSNSQLQRTAILKAEMTALQKRFDAFLSKDLAEANKALAAAKMTPITHNTFEAFKSADSGGSSKDGGQLYVDENLMYKGLTRSGMGQLWFLSWMNL
ncbi:MAG: WD40/YVTN/BNR-like repeat-containing protein [Saprospiraceae bacterium]